MHYKHSVRLKKRQVEKLLIFHGKVGNVILFNEAFSKKSHPGEMKCSLSSHMTLFITI